MAITTSQLAITSEWQQVSAGDCTMQSKMRGVMYRVAVGAGTPTNNAMLTIDLDEPKTFAYKEPVWVSLLAKGPVGNSATINIIK